MVGLRGPMRLCETERRRLCALTSLLGFLLICLDIAGAFALHFMTLYCTILYYWLTVLIVSLSGPFDSL